MFNPSKNPRVARSLDQIALATYELLKTEKLRDLTVTAIAEKAGVTRKTFYRNFGDITDVLDYGLFSRIIPLYQDPRCETYEDFLTSVLEFAVTYKELMLMCKRQGQFTLLTHLGMKYLPGSFYIQTVCARHQGEKGFERTFPLLVASITGGLLEDWINEGFKESVDQVVAKGSSALAALNEKGGYE
jgi:Transcriptional regulator